MACRSPFHFLAIDTKFGESGLEVSKGPFPKFGSDQTNSRLVPLKVILWCQTMEGTCVGC
ncbi:Hypothetical protein CINCED_3A022037 [Cinara cedri]|uniref:Uncharacterized protein n=1 Tax=Cinara cedri TaxID=506608 RepID=A0A5E4MAM1_9HEMI|nr:Hypothetical protein CINCED_3A022037 [Cinara cedri]